MKAVMGHRWTLLVADEHRWALMAADGPRKRWGGCEALHLFGRFPGRPGPPRPPTSTIPGRTQLLFSTRRRHVACTFTQSARARGHLWCRRNNWQPDCRAWLRRKRQPLIQHWCEALLKQHSAQIVISTKICCESVKASKTNKILAPWRNLPVANYLEMMRVHSKETNSKAISLAPKISTGDQF